MNTEKSIFYTRIKKTGSTSLLDHMANYMFDPSKIFVYQPRDNLFTRHDEQNQARSQIRMAKRLLMNFSFYPLIFRFLPKSSSSLTNLKLYSIDEVLEQDPKVIAGEFKADAFDEKIANRFLRIIIFRHPLDRIKSHFRYYMTNGGKDSQLADLKFNPNMTFRDFALSKILDNWMTRALGEKALSEFDLVGITEKLDIFRCQLYRQQGLDPFQTPHPIGHQNRSRFNFGSMELDRIALEEFKKRNSLDYELYRQATEIMEKYK